MSIDPKTQSHLEVYRVLRGEIEHEDQLINHRLSWLVSSQAFMLTAFAITLNAPVLFVNPVYARLNGILYTLLPWTGMVSALLLYPSILGAIIALRRLRRHAEGRIPDCLPPIHGSFLTVALGHCGPLLIPWVFIITWLIMLSPRLG